MDGVHQGRLLARARSHRPGTGGARPRRRPPEASRRRTVAAVPQGRQPSGERPEQSQSAVVGTGRRAARSCRRRHPADQHRPAPVGESHPGWRRRCAAAGRRPDARRHGDERPRAHPRHPSVALARRHRRGDAQQRRRIHHISARLPRRREDDRHVRHPSAPRRRRPRGRPGKPIDRGARAAPGPHRCPARHVQRRREHPASWSESDEPHPIGRFA